MVDIAGAWAARVGDFNKVARSKIVEQTPVLENSSGIAKDAVTEKTRLIVTVIGSLEVMTSIGFPKQTMTSRLETITLSIIGDIHFLKVVLILLY